MNTRLPYLAIFLLAAFFLPTNIHAQDQSDGTLHVLRPSLNAEQDKAEFCLEFDHALDLSDRARILASIRLMSEGKAVPVTQPNVSLAATLLCLQSLNHRQDYSLTVTDLRGAGGEKLNEPYKFSFTVPDRTPALAFAGEPGGDLARYRDSDPILRAVNVARVKIMLYRLTDPARMADAYRQRMQTTLAPSESLTFAKENGQLAWQGKLVLDDSDDTESANRGLERAVPLRKMADTLTPGLYLIAASDEAPHVKTKTAVADLAPLAAQWFIYSDLKVQVLNKGDGFFVETESADDTAVARNVRLLLLGHDQQILAESKSDANGGAFLPLPPDKRAEALTMAGLTETGDIDFVDLFDAAATENRFTLPGLQAGLETDRPFYAPASNVYLTLTARNIHGEAIAMPNSSVELLRPDHSLYAALPVPEGKAAVSVLSFSAPPLNGTWQLQWQQADGHVLAQSPLHVTANGQAPRLAITADRATLDNGGDLNLTLKSKTEAGKSAPYISGHVLVQWTVPDNLAGWSDYHFSNGEKSDNAPAQIAAFITDAAGNIQLNVNLKPPAGHAPLRTAVLTVRADPAAGVLDPDPLSLPVRPDNYAVGIKPFAPDGKFAENSLARFDVIALGGDSKRREANGLKYQIYEEGRSFAWYQAEGHWEYKQLQQRRRIGGGALDIKAAGANTIRWRVTAGAYTLEITDTDGTMIASYRFDAGWGLFKPNQNGPGNLDLASDLPSVQPGTAAKIKFTLDNPAIVSAVIADDQIRKIIFETRQAGDNEIAFTPEENWGERIRVRIEAKQKTDTGVAALAGQIELPVRHAPKELGIATPPMEHIVGGQELVLPVTVGNIASRPLFISVLATPVRANDDSSFLPASVLSRAVEVDANGKASIHLAVPSFAGDLRLKIMASSQSQWAQKEWSVPAQETFDAGLSLSSVMRKGDVAHLALELGNNGSVANTYRYALSADAGLKISGDATGRETLSVKERKPLAFDLEALESGSKEIKLDVTDAHEAHFSRVWPVAVTADGWTLETAAKTEIAPRQTWSLPAHEKLKTGQTLLFVSAEPIFDAPKILGDLIESSPFATIEMTAWLEALRLWQDVAIRAEILPSATLQESQKDILQRLLARQKQDGGFPALPGGDSDLVSTAEALVALTHADPSMTKPAADAAAGWLKQRLANTWFVETERPARTAGFAALAATDRLDVAALRYFAETSADKTLPPLAMAQLAAALAKSGDNDKAGIWLKALHDQLAATPELLPVLADNPLFDPHDLLPVLQKRSAELIHNPPADPQAPAAFLRALWAVNMRSGGWSVAINGADKNQSGILVVTPPAKPATLILRNPMDRLLHVTESERTKIPAREDAGAAIARHFYQLDGNERAAGELGEGETYMVTLEGSWLPENSRNLKLLVRDAAGSSLRPLGCALDGDAASAQPWGWLKNLSLTTASACEASDAGINALLTPSTGKGSWRIAYFALARHAGTFNLAPPTARALSGSEWMTGDEEQIEIK